MLGWLCVKFGCLCLLDFVRLFGFVLCCLCILTLCCVYFEFCILLILLLFAIIGLILVFVCVWLACLCFLIGWFRLLRTDGICVMHALFSCLFVMILCLICRVWVLVLLLIVLTLLRWLLTVCLGVALFTFWFVFGGGSLTCLISWLSLFVYIQFDLISLFCCWILDLRGIIVMVGYFWLAWCIGVQLC